ncbi:MAG: PHP domain-containing protein [Euryarchaeota archaeon]|nr:PHP domain-containing protein [Euryarchaeota archaeon]
MKIDMHIHTSYSPDGKVQPKEVLKYARKIGLDAVAITDHNEIKGALKAKRADIIPVIPGIEVSTSAGHVLAYGVDCVIPRGLSVLETIEKIHDCGGIAVIAHPYRFWSGVGEEEVLKVRDAVDAIEVLNARCKKKSNIKAQKLAERLDKPGTAGSDAHVLEGIGKAYLELNCDVSEFLDCVLKAPRTVHGSGRSAWDTVKYVEKAISEWIGRGFKKI